MKKLLLSVSIIAIIVLLVCSFSACSAKYTLKKDMLNDQYFSGQLTYKSGYSGTEEYFKYKIHLTMNKNKTYDFYFDHGGDKRFVVDEENDPIEEITGGKWTLVYASKLKYEVYNEIGLVQFRTTEKTKIAFFKLEGCFDKDGKQRYLIYGYSGPMIFATDYEITKEYIDNTRNDVTVYGETTKTGHPNFSGIELVVKGSKNAEWK